MASSNLVALALAAGAAFVLVGPCATPLRKHPVPFYCVAVALTCAYAWFMATGDAGPTGIQPLLAVFQKGYVATILLGIVMFTGVLDERSALRGRLQPIRGELSILSFIFILGHVISYGGGYLPRLSTLAAGNGHIVASLGVAVLLTAVFAVLSVMSFRVVRRSMNPATWKAIQRASYAMMVLLVLHVGLMLGKSAFGGGLTRSTAAFGAYLAVVAIYALLRIRKALRDKNAGHTEGVGTAAGANSAEHGAAV